MTGYALVLVAVTAAIVGAVLGAAFLPLPSSVSASEHTATRSFAPETVVPGGDVVVTISASGYGQFGGVVETLPLGFIYKSSSRPDTAVRVDGQDVTFALFGESSFTYTVTAPSVEDAHIFSGRVKNDQGDYNDVGGASSVTVAAAPSEDTPADHTATRSFTPETVVPGGDVVVTINASGYGQFGGVVETLPLGFTYKSSSRPDSAVVVDGQEVTFALFGESSFTYIVTASSVEDAHTFSGRVKNDQGDYNDVGGASSVTVAVLPSEEIASEHSATRSFSPETVVPGGDVVVTISASGYGQFGGVVETLPLGFTYKSSSRPDSAVAVDGREAIFALFGESSFTYTVTASSVEEAHIFSGRVKNDQGDYNDVGGASSVTVAVLPSEEMPSEHTATRSFSPETVVPGGDVVVTIRASGYGQFGGVVETLPLGFIYKLSSRPDSAVAVDGQEVTFALFGESSFTYTVTASSVEDAHTFSGRVKNDQGDYNDVGGASSVTVATPKPTIARPSTGGGGRSGGGVTAPALATVAPTATPVAMATPEATATPVAMATPETAPEVTPERPAMTPEPIGPTGQAGPTGQPGAAGDDGKDGADGRAGALGRAGVDGSDGADGATGQDGNEGATGRDGSDGTAGRDGAPGSKGAKGDTGSQGGAGNGRRRGRIRCRRQWRRTLGHYRPDNRYSGRGGRRWWVDSQPPRLTSPTT